MQAVLLSIRPEWSRKIVTGEKTIEVRKTKPVKAKLPFLCYLYETSEGNGLGKVIAGFICDATAPYTYPFSYSENECCTPLREMAKMTPAEVWEYGQGRTLYGWHISKLVIYDKPRSLSEFCFPPERFCEKGHCGGCPYDEVPNEYREVSFDCRWERPLPRPPQSWCYVKEIQT